MREKEGLRETYAQVLAYIKPAVVVTPAQAAVLTGHTATWCTHHLKGWQGSGRYQTMGAYTFAQQVC